MSYYATTIHAKAYDIASAYFGNRFTTYRKTPMLQVGPKDLPLLAVHILRERREQDEHANHGEPKFKHALTLGFSGAIHAETEDQNKLYLLEDAMSELDDALLTNPKFVALTEGITSMDRISQYAKVGETTLFEIRVEMTMEFSSYFPPIVPDMLEHIHVETRYPKADTDPEKVMQIIREYDIDTGT